MFSSDLFENHVHGYGCATVWMNCPRHHMITVRNYVSAKMYILEPKLGLVNELTVYIHLAYRRLYCYILLH